MGCMAVSLADLVKKLLSRYCSFLPPCKTHHHLTIDQYYGIKVKFSGISRCGRFKNSKEYRQVLFWWYLFFFSGLWFLRSLRIQPLMLLSKAFICWLFLDNLAKPSQWLFDFYSMQVDFLPFFFLFCVCGCFKRWNKASLSRNKRLVIE